MPSGQQSPDIVLNVDLTTARALSQLIPPGIAIKQVYIATLPSGANFALRFGVNNPPVPMVQTGGRVFTARRLVEGLYVDNTAQPGLTAVVTVVTGEK